MEINSASDVLGYAQQFFSFVVHFILKIDVYLETIVQDYGTTTYGILFLIIFAETGLVVTPFLPGDSLLFAAGALAGRGALEIGTLFAIVIVAAVAGDTVNYAIGKFFGEKLFRDQSRFLKKEYIERTNRFYERYGAKAIIFCRFVPIVRTFAPFVAGFGQMNYGKFTLYNVSGAILWSVVFLTAGYFFGDLPVVRKSMTMMILGIIVLSVLPLVYEVYKARRQGAKTYSSTTMPISKT